MEKREVIERLMKVFSKGGVVSGLDLQGATKCSAVDLLPALEALRNLDLIIAKPFLPTAPSLLDDTFFAATPKFHRGSLDSLLRYIFPAH